LSVAGAWSATVQTSGGHLAPPNAPVALDLPDSLRSQLSPDATLDLEVLAPADEPGVDSTLKSGSAAFELNLTEGAGTEQVHELPVPLTLTYSPSDDELKLADGDLDRVRLVVWTGSTWAPLSCSAVDHALSCTLGHLSMFRTVVLPTPDGGPLDWSLGSSGWFYKEANGYGGVGTGGYAVLDDTNAQFWTEFQRYGGVQAVGYPISQRFMYQGFLTQAFQRMALQWRVDQQQAVPVNVFDDLSSRGSDAWLESARQVPPAVDTSADAGLIFEDVVKRHLAMLDAYPALRSYYDASDHALERFGLPLAVEDYGAFVAVRMQRATLQLWTRDTPWAAAGQVVVGNGADVAKEAGLWPVGAIGPVGPPTQLGFKRVTLV
jgi:hypothetical protein